MNYVIQYGDFAGTELLFNDPFLPAWASVTGEQLGGFDGPKASAHINLLPVWDEYGGEGIWIGTNERISYTHYELEENYLQAHAFDRFTYDPIPPGTQYHGTSVAGLLVAEAGNGIGNAGIAYQADLTSSAGYGDSATIAEFQSRYDIVTNSTAGAGNTFAPYGLTGFQRLDDRYATMTSTGRDGLGTVIFNSAGNGPRDSSLEVTANIISKYLMPIGKMDGDGVYDGTSFGSALHISAPVNSANGSEVLVTLDPAGEAGAVQAGEDFVTSFLDGTGLTPDDYGGAIEDFIRLGGTSASTPVTAASTALVLEAAEKNNIYGSALGWRDVQEILALSARYTAQGADPYAGPAGSWTVSNAPNFNGYGLTFQPNVGFGMLDVHAAVRLAETWSQTSQTSNMATASSSVTPGGQAIGDGLTYTFTITEDVDIDFTELVALIDHENARELQIDITAPSGIQSTVLDTPLLTNDNIRAFNGFGAELFQFPLLSRAFWGESSVGTWTVTVHDMVDNEINGTVNSLELSLIGDAATEDDTYFFTDDAAATRDIHRHQTGATVAAVPVLDDGAGRNALNFAAMTSAVSADLASGAVEVDTGLQLFTVGAGLAIETMIGTDRGDSLTGDGGANILHGRQGGDTLDGAGGADSLVGYTGDDRLIGGGGADVAVYTGRSTDFTIAALGDGTLRVTDTVSTDGLDEGSDILSEIESLFFEGDGVTIDATVNAPPEVTIADQTIDAGASRGLASVLSVTDADGDAITEYELRDTTGADNWLVNGDPVDASGAFRTDDLAGITFRGDAAAGRQTLSVRAFDGTDWSAWTDFALTTEAVNTRPVVQVDDLTLGALEERDLADIITVADAEGDAITRYRVFDSAGGEENWFIAGEPVQQGRSTTADDLSQISLRADSGASTQALWVSVFDGTDWSRWDRFTLTTEATVNAPPVVTIGDQVIDAGASRGLASVLSVTDADGDAITQYELRDTTGTDNWLVNGDPVDASGAFRTDELAGITFRGDPGAGTQTLSVRAFDGTDWSAWTDFALTTETTVNTAPVVQIDDLTVGALEDRNLADIITVSDADGDAITRYRVFDSGPDEENWFISGEPVSPGRTGFADDLSQISLRGDAGAGTQTLWVSAFDGTDWGRWDPFRLTTLEPSGNSAPVLDVQDVTVNRGQWTRLDTVLTFTDADGDSFEQLELRDTDGGQNWWADSGRVDAATGYVTARLTGTWFQGDLEVGSSTLSVRGYDGTDWGAWETFVVETV